jgi:hypothetical protein
MGMETQPEKVWPGKKHLESLNTRVFMLEWWHQLFKTLFPVRVDGVLDDAEMWEQRTSLYEGVSAHLFLRLRRMIVDELALEMCRLLDPVHSGGGQNRNEVLALLVDESQILDSDEQIRVIKEKCKAAKGTESRMKVHQRRAEKMRGHVPDGLQRRVVEAEDEVERLEDEIELAHLLKQARIASGKLRVWRNKRKAHSALGGSSEGSKDRWLFSPEDLEKTKKAIFAFMKRVRRVRGNHHVDYEQTIVEHDGLSLIRALLKAKDYDELVENGTISKARRLWAIVEDAERRESIKETAEHSGVWENDSQEP